MADSIVRSLLVNIGFQVKKSDEKNVSRSINKVKSNLSVLYSSSLYLYSQLFRGLSRVFSQVSSGFTDFLDNKEFSSSISLTIREVESLEKAFSDFRIGGDEFRSIFQRIQKDIDDFRLGDGRLPNLLFTTGIQFSPDEGVLGLFTKLIEYIRKFRDEDKGGIINAIFPGSNIERIKELSKSFDDFRDSVKGAYDQLKDSPNISEQAAEYERKVNDLSRAWVRFSRDLLSLVYPAIKFILDVLNNLVSSADHLINNFKISDLPKILDPFPSLGGDDYSAIMSRERLRFSPSNANINTEINISVPNSAVDDPDSLATTLKEQIDEALFRSYKEIQYDNPVIE